MCSLVAPWLAYISYSLNSCLGHNTMNWDPAITGIAGLGLPMSMVTSLTVATSTLGELLIRSDWSTSLSGK